MKRRGIGVLGATVLYWALQATTVLARGGGGRGGSYSRGFSGGGLRGGGYSGGFSGGGLSHGFFPFFFFGGGGGLFSSFFSIIILLVIAALVLRFFVRSRYFGGGRNARTSNNEYGEWESSGPVDFEGRAIKNERGRFGEAISYTRKNMDYYAQKFPRWDYGLLAGRVRQVFFYLQDAWARQDLSEGPEYLERELLEQYQAKLEAMKSRGERNIVRDPELGTEDIDFVHSQLEAGDERFVARIFASLIDYTVDASGRVISGEEDNRLYFSEFWEFIWQDSKWKLRAIYQEDSVEAARWARGEQL